MEAPDDQGLDGKVAIVTGAGAADDGIGNGRAAAILLARAGCKVLAVDRDAALAERTVAMIGEHGGDGAAFACDVTKESDCAAMVAEAVQRWGRLDVLDNNVGIGSRGPVTEVSPAEWAKVIDVNVTSMYLTSRHAIPEMRKVGGGAIVNISSISALRPRGLTTYTVSKGAVIALTQAMAVDHGAENIRVNCIAPGPVYTPMVYALGMSDKARDTRRRASVLGTEGTGWDIGNAVVFLSSARARYITGHVLVVDGGVTLQAPQRESEGN
ncbi:MAG: SDR family oxidoreductase [Alphaproteobacteria bacterium]